MAGGSWGASASTQLSIRPTRKKIHTTILMLPATLASGVALRTVSGMGGMGVFVDHDLLLVNTAAAVVCLGRGRAGCGLLAQCRLTT